MCKQLFYFQRFVYFLGHQHSAQAYLAGSSFVYSFSQHKMYFDVRRSLRPLINSLLAHDFYSLRAHRRLNGAREPMFPMNRVKSQPWNCFRLFFSRRSPSQSLRTILLAIRSIKTADNTRVVFTASHFLIIFTQALNFIFCDLIYESLRWSFGLHNSRLQHLLSRPHDSATLWQLL